MSTRRKSKRENPKEASALYFLSVAAVSKRFGFHPNTIRKWINDDGLRHIRYGPGRKIFIRLDDVKAFLKHWYGIDLESEGHERSDM